MPTMAFYPPARAATIESNEVAADHRSASSTSTPSAAKSTSGTRAPWRRRGQASWKQAAHQQLLSQSWRDREHDKFVEEFEKTLSVIGKFLETSEQYVPFLVRKADRAEEYLRQR